MKHLQKIVATALILYSNIQSAQQNYKLPRVTPAQAVGIVTVGIASYVGYKYVVGALRKRAFIEATVQKYDVVRKLAQQDKTLLDMQTGPNQETALHGAVRNKDSVMVKLLLDLGASHALQNKERQTAGDLALLSEDEHVLKAFFDKGYLKKEKAQYNFEQAIILGDEYGADLAKDQGADVNKGWRATMKGTLLHKMVHMRGLEHTKILLSLGADTSLLNEHGQTAEDLLADCKDKRGQDILQLLQKHRKQAEEKGMTS